MAKGYYTVIVGTQPGVYADWTQAASKVNEIPGNIHKKFKTLAEAWEAYHQAAREGRVRAVRLYPEPEAESPPGSQIQEEALHEYPVAQPTFHSATGPGQRFHRSHAAASSMGVGMMTSKRAGPSHLAERMSHETVPREHHGFGQQYWPASDIQALHPMGSPSSRGHSNERREECQHCSVRAPLPILPRAEGSRTAIAYERARSASTSAERRRQVLDSPSAATFSRSPLPSHGHATRTVLRSPQMEDNRRYPGNIARQNGRPRSASPLADGRLPDDIGSQSSDGFLFNFQPHLVNRPLYFEPPRASGSHQGPVVNPVASPRAPGMSDKKGKKRASVQSSDAFLERSEIQTSASAPQTGAERGDSLGPPGPLLPSPARSHISLASSSSVFSFEFEVNISPVETHRSPGRSAHVAGSPPAPQPAVSPLAISNAEENAIPALSTQRQEEGLNEEENGDDSQASSDDTRVEISDDVVDPLDHTNPPRADRSVAFDDSPSLSRPLSPLIITSTSRSATHSTHLLAQCIRPSGLDTTSSSSSWVWPLWSPSLPPHVTSVASSSTEVTGLGLSIEGILSSSPPSQSRQHQATTPAPPGTPHRLAGNVEGQCSTRHASDTSPRDAPVSRAPATPPNLRSALSDLTPQSGVVPSPRNVPLPSSPTTSTSGSPVRLQTQPSHRVTPRMPFYPSLAVDDSDDDAPSTPSRLGIASGRPTPQRLPSPIQAPAAASRHTSSLADPRSPISRLTRIPGSIMEISRNLFFGRPTPPGNDSDARRLP